MGGMVPVNWRLIIETDDWEFRADVVSMFRGKSPSNDLKEFVTYHFEKNNSKVKYIYNHH